MSRVPNEFVVERPEPGIALVRLRGELETYNAVRLERELATLTASGATLVIDLEEASFLDSSILAVLLNAQTRSEQRGTGCILAFGAGTGWAVRRIFEITGIDSRFTLAASRAEALDAARPARAA